MSRAIEDLTQHEEQRRLMNRAAMQDDFVQRYAAMIPDDRRRDDFRRELVYLISLTYREAQEPLVKQLTDFVMTQNRPLIFPKEGV